MSTIVISKSTKARRPAAYIPGNGHPKKKVVDYQRAPIQWKQVVEHDKIFSI